MANAVDYLLSKPFESLTYEEKLDVVKQGRPKPALKSWVVQVSENCYDLAPLSDVIM